MTIKKYILLLDKRDYQQYNPCVKHLVYGEDGGITFGCADLYFKYDIMFESTIAKAILALGALGIVIYLIFNYQHMIGTTAANKVVITNLKDTITVRDKMQKNNEAINKEIGKKNEKLINDNQKIIKEINSDSDFDPNKVINEVIQNKHDQ